MIDLITIEEAAARPIAAVRRTASLAELPKVIPPALDEVLAVVKARPDTKPGRTVVLYISTATAFDMEIGVEVAPSFVGEGNVLRCEIPAGHVAHGVHMGSYAQLPQANAEMRNWCRDRGLPLAGQCWEIYADWTEDEARLRTDIYYLLEQVPWPPTD